MDDTTLRTILAIEAQQTQRQAWKRALRSQLFDKQIELYDDPCPLKAAHPGRRSGKSEFIPRGALLDVLDAGFNEVVIIGAETQKKAKALHWRNLGAIATVAGIPLKPNIQAGSWETPWGASIVFWGLCDQGAVDLLRGFKLKSSYFDEVATYATLLRYLCEDVVEPALGDTGGSLYLCGTPSHTRAGRWFEVCNGDVPGWSVHHWTVLENKRFPRDARKMLAEWLRSKQLTEEDPTFQREWMGRFVNDIKALVYRFLAERNLITALPEDYDRRSWYHAIGVDFGTSSPSAFVTVAWHPHSPKVYAIRAEKMPGLLASQACDVLSGLCDSFRPIIVVGDMGGLGKPYMEEWNRRYAGREVSVGYHLPPIMPADKQGKRANQKMLNDDLGTARFLVLSGDAKPLADEMATLPFYRLDVPDDQLKEHPAHENHCCDGALYVYTSVRAYLNRPPDPALHERDPDDAVAWLERQEAEELQGQVEDWERY